MSGSAARTGGIARTPGDHPGRPRRQGWSRCSTNSVPTAGPIGSPSSGTASSAGWISTSSTRAGELPGGPYTPPINGKAVTDRPPGARPDGPPPISGRPPGGRVARDAAASTSPSGSPRSSPSPSSAPSRSGSARGGWRRSVQPSSPPAEAAAAAVTPPSPSPTPTPTPTPTPVFAPTGETTQATVTQRHRWRHDHRLRRRDGVPRPLHRRRRAGARSISTGPWSSWPVRPPTRTAGSSAARTSSSSATSPRPTQYGQLLRHVWVDRDGTLVLVGLEMVRAGCAKVDLAGPDQKYADAAHVGGGRRADRRHRDVERAAAPAHRPDADPARDVPAAPGRRGADHRVQLVGELAAGGPGGLHLALGGVRRPVRARALGPARVRDPDLPVRLAPRIRRPGRPSAARSRSTSTAAPPASSRSRSRFSEAVLTITTTCPTWTFSLQGTSRPSRSMAA